ncbi:TolC family protein [Pelagicoccus mobilis]|uniref:TolC family protein n=1 Tax=Pelagicoccus mobilis TaxID=415221 RepID=A0A934S2D8_9BACT|nr:TolC family protein [Pelagicoccus mobilis]MBK1879930.1 TolC family protein [Pelagicoccus mobilis]
MADALAFQPPNQDFIMFKPIVAALLAAALSVNELPGQTHDHSEAHLDRSTAIQAALRSNKDLIAARVAIEKAEARLKAAGLPATPNLHLEYKSDILFGDEGEGGYGAAISQSFPGAKRLSKKKDVTRFEIEKAKLEVRQREIEIITEISEFALDIHLVDTRMDHLEKLGDFLLETIRFATEKVSSGEISPLDVSQLTLEKRILEQEIANLEITRERLIHKLAPLIGQHSSDHFEFDADNALPYSNGELPGFDLACLNRSPAFQTALVKEKAADAKTQLALTEGKDYPTGRLFWNNEKGVDQPAGRTSDHVLGISVSIPLPAGKKADLLSLESRQEKDQARLAAAAIRFRIENDIEHAKHEAEISQRRMSEYSEQVIEFADQQLQEMQTAYQTGQLDMLSLLRAQEQRVSLENGYLELYEENAHARLELQLARFELP